MDGAGGDGEVDDDEWAVVSSPDERCFDDDDDDRGVAGQPGFSLTLASDVDAAAVERNEAASWHRRRPDPADRELQGSSATPGQDEFVVGSGTTPPSGAAAGCGAPLRSAASQQGGQTAGQVCTNSACLGCTLSQGATVSNAFAFTQGVMQTPTAGADPAAQAGPGSVDSTSSFAVGTGAGAAPPAIWSLPPRAPPVLLSPPPAISTGEPFCLETESSTLLSIMDELETADDAAAEAEHNRHLEKGCADTTEAILRDVPVTPDCAAAIAETLVALAVEAEMLHEEDDEDDPSELPAEEEAALRTLGHPLAAEASQRTEPVQSTRAIVSAALDPAATALAEQSQAPTIANRYAGFRCSCSGGCCLDQLSGEELKAAYAYTLPKGPATSPSTVFEKLHGLLWNMKEPLAARNARGHSYKVTDWSYNKKSLCREGWQTLMNGTAWCHRQALASVLRGVSPHDTATERGAKLMLHTQTRTEAEATEKRRLTVDWLHRKFLCTMEFMPNENRIVLRGVGTTILHREQYTTSARKGGFYLSYKHFMRCMKAAAIACVEEEHGVMPGQSSKVRVSRSARHSKFPACTACDVLSKDYVTDAANPLADPQEVEQKLSKLLAHQKQFMADRTLARRLRCASYDPQSSTLYECDDKCGSFWCKCPVASGGRANKGNVKQVYEFAVQANVVCGPGGVMRLAIIPKTVTTGANFGLSTLLSSLYSAHLNKRLHPHVRCLLRHTDGGPDNVAKRTHIFHWLLVYVGCWEEVRWFMFDAGHSHTEIADRLFSLMKRLFETDSAATVKGGITSFEDLEERLKSCFAKCPEMKEIVYHFANWDIDNWLKESVGVRLASDDLRLFSFDHVYRYLYVGALPCENSEGAPSNMAREHGGVQVTYKANLSSAANNYYDCEWAPIRRVTEQASSGADVTANRTIPSGVVFVTNPPNLTVEPSREETSEKHRDHGREAIARVLKREDLSGDQCKRARAFWHALKHMHGNGLVESVPTLPCTISATADGETAAVGTAEGEAEAGMDSGAYKFLFKGTAPTPMLPMLKRMVRFPRPFITWDIFNSSPPLTFPDTPATPSSLGEGGAAPEQHEQGEAESVGELRNPDKVNRVVHRHHGRKRQKAAQERLSAAAWLEEDSDEEKEPNEGDLFVVHLADCDADGEYKMGLVHITTGKVEMKQLQDGDGTSGSPSEPVPSVPSVEAAWFQRSGKGRVWGKSPTFEWHPKLKEWQKKSKREEDRRRVTEWLHRDSLLVRVTNSDLTEKSRTAEVRLVRPRLREKFMQKLHQLAVARSLVVPEKGRTGAQKQAVAVKGRKAPVKGRKAVAAEADSSEEDEEDEEEEEEEEEDNIAPHGGPTFPTLRLEPPPPPPPPPDAAADDAALRALLRQYR